MNHEPGDRLRESLLAVHEELASTREVDPELRLLLETILVDIGRLLEHSPTRSAETEPQEAASGLLDRLTGAARHFEESHPSLSSAVGNVADALGQLGI